MNSHVIIVFFLVLLMLSGCDNQTKDPSGVSDKIKADAESKQTSPLTTAQAEAFKSEKRLVTNPSIIKSQLSAYSKSYMDIADVYVLSLQVGDEIIKLTSLKYVDISSKINASKTILTFTKPKNYLIFYSYDAQMKQGSEMRIPTDSLKVGQLTDFPVLNTETGKLISTRIKLLKIQHK